MSSSCLKIISCGGRDAFDDDDNHLESSPQGRGTNDKRRWSFRKRSARHRVLNNTVSETSPSGNKESLDSAAFDFQRQPNSSILEKSSELQWTEEKPKLSAPVSSTLSEAIAAEADDAKADATPDKSVVIFIQAAIRTFLAQNVLLKHKNIIKLQAAVRGHLVRRHAVGTLQCVQAIVKMQALVRARHARILKERCDAGEMPHEKRGKDETSTPMGKGNTGNSPHVTYVSIEKLLSNRFARQLLESTPRTRPINIKCDPSKSDSAWKWLERWMSVSSTDDQSPLDTVLQDEKEIEQVATQEATAVPSESNCKSPLNSSSEASESDEHHADRFDVQPCMPASPSVSHILEQKEPHSTSETKSEDMYLDSLPTETRELELPGRVELNTIAGDTDTEGEQPCLQSVERVANQPPETEGKKLVFGNRKASNPAFLAAQSKFEELSSAANSTKSISSTNQNAEDEPYSDTISSFTDHASQKESGLAENFVSDSSKLQYGGSDASGVQFDGSECGTELSISSTLDSPERFGVGATELEQESKIIEDMNGHPESKDNLVEVKFEPTILDSSVHDVDALQLETNGGSTGANDDQHDSSITVYVPHVESKPETEVSKLQLEAESEKDHHVSSPEASPRGHITGPVLQGTPSSEVSLTPKRTKGDKTGSNRKARSASAGKRSPTNPNHDSGARRSIEQLPKDQKNGKRRNSIGSPKPDHVDQDPRDSSSSNPLPSYMQTTESARAKALLNSSPRSSPDVLDKEVFIKKRHSLPGSNGRHGSPQIQRTTSQEQQTVKGNGTQSPQEKKWRR